VHPLYTYPLPSDLYCSLPLLLVIFLVQSDSDSGVYYEFKYYNPTITEMNIGPYDGICVHP